MKRGYIPPARRRANRLKAVPRKTVPRAKLPLSDIYAEWERLNNKVWWNRHMSHHKPERSCNSESMIGCDQARIMLDKYGEAFLYPGDDIEWGITLGKMMALYWVIEGTWDGSGDT
jgi:hypothetical protein